jgi:hypothetical protein
MPIAVTVFAGAMMNRYPSSRSRALMQVNPTDAPASPAGGAARSLRPSVGAGCVSSAGASGLSVRQKSPGEAGTQPGLRSMSGMSNGTKGHLKGR